MKKTSISLFVFQVFKCLIYVLLTANIFFFYQEESLAVKSTFSQGISITDIIQGFAATLDTAAWVMLLFLFELNTSEYLKRLNLLNNAFIAKNTCASLYKSCGVRATPAKNTIPMKKSTAATHAQK